MARPKKQANGWDDFDFVPASPVLSRAALAEDPVVKRRTLMTAAIDRQLEMWADDNYHVEKVTVEKRDDGTSYKKRTMVRPREWWQESGGEYFLSPRYGARPLEIRKGLPVVRLSEEEVEVFLTRLRTAVENGELDKLLEVVAQRHKG